MGDHNTNFIPHNNTFSYHLTPAFTDKDYRRTEVPNNEANQVFTLSKYFSKMRKILPYLRY